MPILQRYSGEELGSTPHIVVLGSCKVGNFVVSTPALRGLKERFPDAILGFVGSEVTSAFETTNPFIDWRVSWDLNSTDAGLRLHQFIADRVSEYGLIALAVNLDGFNPVTCSLASWLRPRFVAGGCLSENLRKTLPPGDRPEQKFLQDPDWDSIAFLDRYKGIFDTNYIAELFCRLSFVADFVDFNSMDLSQVQPPFVVPDVLIHCTTARGAKVWPFQCWQRVIDHLSSKGLSVGLVGSPPAAQKEAYNSYGHEDALLAETALIDLRGQTSLIELAGASARARAVISVDAGPLHIAAAVGTPTLAIVGNDSHGIGASPIRLWMPRSPNIQRTVSDVTCTACADNRYRNDDCIVPGHACMLGVKPEQVINWLDQLSPALYS